MATSLVANLGGAVLAAAASVPKRLLLLSHITRRSKATLSGDDIATFHEDGYVIARGLFSSEEVDLVHRALNEDTLLAENIIPLNDANGGVTNLVLWSNPGNGTLGMLIRSERMVRNTELLLGNPVVHYHSKKLLKDAYSGGAWNWHQDYGYWYKDYFLTPDMLTAYVAIDRQTEDNGCLKVVPKSHKVGRLEHWSKGDQQGADLERAALVRDRLGEVNCLLSPGDCIFFHSLLLHSSQQNKSPNSRLALAACYTAANNVQFKNPYIPCFPLDVVSDYQLLARGLQLTTSDELSILEPALGVESAKKETAEFAG